MRPRACLLALALLAASLPAAAEVTFRAEVGATRIGLDDTIGLTATLAGRSIDLAGDIAPPELTGLRIVGGPAVSTQVSFVNGAMSQSRSLTWVLQPTAVGVAEIGALSAPLKSGVKTTEPIRIEVVEGSVLPARPAAADPFGRGSPLSRGDPFEDFFDRRPRTTPKVLVEAVPSRTRLHVGEPLLLTFWLYTQTSLAGLDFESAPSTPGFWAEELPREEQPQGELVTRDGEQFRRFPVFRRLLFPMKAGHATLPPATLRVMLPSTGFFDRGGALARSTAPVDVEVLPLPTTDGFATGAVGRFTVRASADRTSLTIGEAATVRFTVAGAGNLKWLDAAPHLAVAGAKVYPPQARADVKVTPAGLSGTRTWEFVVVPETAGRLDVPAIEFAYFDPSAGRVIRTASAPLALEVAGAAIEAVGAGRPAVVARADRDLRLRADPEPSGAALPELSAGTVGLAVGLALAGHALLLAVPRLTRTGRRPGGRAPSVRGAIADLRRARRGGGSKEAAALLIEKALRDVFGDLDERGAADGEREREVRAVLHGAQFIRYAPQLGDYTEKLEEVAARAEAAIRRWG